jgi:hypothetical protein
MLSVVMLSEVMLSVVMLSVVMLSVVMLNVSEPKNPIFQILFIQEIGSEFDVGVAVDDVVLTECQLKPAQEQIS